jgi:hypothetical protein
LTLTFFASSASALPPCSSAPVGHMCELPNGNTVRRCKNGTTPLGTDCQGNSTIKDKNKKATKTKKKSK